MIRPKETDKLICLWFFTYNNTYET